MTRSKLMAILVAVVMLSAELSAQQDPSLRATPQHLSSALLLKSQPAQAPVSLSAAIWRTSPTTRGALIVGGIGLVLSSVAMLLYVEATDPGNHSGPVIPIVVGTTAVGAVIGAAIGAGSSR